MVHAAKIFLTHLRLPFQAVLAPFLLFGLVAANEPPTVTWLIAFLVVHVGLYGGATVYNSYYDRDIGPIGMLRSPPRVTRAMCHVSLLLQGASIGILTLVRPWAGGVAALMMALGIAYSHPRTRLKGRTTLGLLAVAFGQGALAVLLGYAIGTAASPSLETWLLASAATLIALGLYPLTQIYQIDEDRERGDVTLPVRWGFRRAMRFSGAVSLIGLGVLAYGLESWLAVPLPLPWPALWALLGAGTIFYLARWEQRFVSLGPYGNHDRAMVLAVGVAVPLTLFLLYALTLRLH